MDSQEHESHLTKQITQQSYEKKNDLIDFILTVTQMVTISIQYTKFPVLAAAMLYIFF